MKRICVVTLLMTVLLVSCGIDLEERGLQFAQEYVGIPESAENIQAFYWGFGQARTVFVKFDLPHNDLDPFLATTCFRGLDNFYNRYPGFHITSDMGGEPEWWLTAETPIMIEGGCDDGMAYRIGISETETTFTLYLALVVP